MDQGVLDRLRLCFAAPPGLLAEAVVRLRAAWDERAHAPELALAR